jgi:hypothetical protein
MSQGAIRRLLVGALLALLPPCGTAHAHAFVQPYTLPVPFWLYLYGCAATLVVTFMAMGYFARATTEPRGPRGIELRAAGGGRAAAAGVGLALLRAGALGCLLLAIVAGLVGTKSPLANINMTLFWIGFLLGFTYLTAVIGNLYDLINPWKTIVAALEGCGIDFTRPGARYPVRLGYYPAFFFYVALIWIELFWLPKPVTLSLVLMAYTLVTIAGAWACGKAAWFEHAELFSVFFRLVGTLAPVAYVPGVDRGSWKVRLRPPFAGALEERPDHPSLVLFVLFMLASTTYDGVHGTVFWVGLFWKNLLSLLHPLWGDDMAKAQAVLGGWFTAYDHAGLVLCPFLYFTAYTLVMAATRVMTRNAIPLGVLAMQFAFTLIPIALVYNIAHYSTLILQQLPLLPYLASDPFGLGWNLFGLAPDLSEPPPLDMGSVWHSEVGFILAGHMVSVCLAHLVALRLFPSRPQAMLSQLPMLGLMVTYTIVGLWVLSLPLALH